jgi:DNA mismatch repair protein MutL
MESLENDDILSDLDETQDITKIGGSDSKIIVLPEKVSQLIAAGEVIERTASCVKELVENSLDSGANSIEVFFNGKYDVSVFDDGEGMVEKDVLLCFKKHATSKIKDEKDLEAIKTFGFRGEALHAISLVSKTKIRSKHISEDIGTEIYIEGGKFKGAKKVYLDTGTQVIVKDLFFNTPARRKFLSNERIEFSYVLDVFSRFALAFPNVSFKLMKNDEVYLNLKSGRTLKDTISSIFGEDKVRKDSFELFLSVGDIELEGIVWREKVGVGRWTFINKRYVKDKTVFSAFSKFPFLRNSDFILFINCPPEFYDVNVNPTKTEIRWRAPLKVREIIITAIEEAIRHKVKAFYQTNQDQANQIGVSAVEKDLKAEPQHIRSSDKPEAYKNDENKGIYVDVKQEKIIRASPKILSLIGGIFAVIEWEGEIYIVDIHAYHEGKLYAEMREKLSAEKFEKLRFAIPFEVNLSKSACEKVLAHRSEFEKIGIEFEVFQDENKILVWSIPTFLSGVDLSDFFVEFQDGVSEEAKDQFLASYSCRNSIRKGDSLNIWDIAFILQDFDVNQRCPHGRPAVIKLTIDELEKRFGRC